MGKHGAPRPWKGRLLVSGLHGTLVLVVGLTFVDTSTAQRPVPGADDIRGDPTVMTEAAAHRLTDGLESSGWDCYASLAEPPLTRCFTDRRAGDSGESRAEVAVTVTGSGTVGRIRLHAWGSDDAGLHRHVALLAADQIGTHLLGGQGEALAARVGRFPVASIAGQEAWTLSQDASSVTLVVRAPLFEGPALPEPDLPPAAALVDAGSALGMTCSAPSATTTCSAAGRGPARSVTVSEAGGRTSSVILSAASLRAADAARVLRNVLPLVRRSGLGGPQMLTWLREHGHEPVALGDVNGVHVSLARDHSDVHTTIYLTFGGIYS